MSRLVGLKMQGIRSIDEEPQIINFLDPLTIIQGPNGSGKTTIIEALNYVTSGALPSGRLASFIHNNKLSNKKRVDALIQLQFTDFRGNNCTATKRMCAAQTVGKDKVSTKSDEFNLKITQPNGETRTISAKVADFNKQVENLFGVPAAVLQHVIFCHQEDSTWPLGEPKELKTKFDAIFEVEKFVKVMESIKKSVKDFEGELKIVNTELPHIQRYMQDLGLVFMQLDDTKNKLVDVQLKIRANQQAKSSLENQLFCFQVDYENTLHVEREIQMKEQEIALNRQLIDKAKLTGDKLAFDGNRIAIEEELETIRESSEYAQSLAERDDANRKKDKLNEAIVNWEASQTDLREAINNMEGRRSLADNLRAERERIISTNMEKFQLACERSEFLDELNKEIKKAESDLQNFLNKKESEKDECNNKITDIREKIASYTIIDKMKQVECDKLRDQIESLRKELLKSQNSSNRIIEIKNEINERIDMLKTIQAERTESMSTLRETLQKLNVFSSVNVELDEMESLTLRYESMVIANNSAFGELIKHSMSESDSMSESNRHNLTVFQKQLDQAADERKHAHLSIDPLQVELKSVESQVKTLNENVEKERTTLNQRLQNMQNVVERMHQIDAELKNIDAELRLQNLDEYQTKLRTVEKEIRSAQSEISRLVSVVLDCDKRSHILRWLEDSLRISSYRSIIEQLQGEINNIKATLLKRSSKEVSVDMRRIEKDISQITEMINKKNGEKNILEQTQQDLQKRLKGQTIDDIKTKLKEKVIERISIENAIQDLKNLAKVMDDSIIKYHAQKMEQINSILSFNWPRVYQGNDIETIQIKSQPIEGSEKRKSYDYSVVMVVDQVEIEMRDCCSAGQKMLASILIRIALAEVFGGNCPILALDEPTTNLDSLKVENVGAVLKNLLEAYQTCEQQFHLQLIVITHDKRLVEQLYTTCRPEYVYGLSKDENGVSKVRVHHQITEV